MTPCPSEHHIRREIALLERHLTCWPLSPRLKMRLAEERAKLNRIETARAQALRELRIPNLARWSPELPPFQPRCRHCGSKINAREIRCSSCWRPL